MKKTILLLGTFLTLFLISCEGPVGPPGLDGFDGEPGPPGEDGINILGQVFDIEATFDGENNFGIRHTFPQSVEVFETDVILVYLLWDQAEDDNGEPIDIWRLLPQTRLLDQGILQYNYEHTFLDVDIFLEADFDLETLPAADTDNQVFRIAVVPAEMSATAKIDKSNIVSVMSALGVEEKDVQRVKL